MGDLNKKIIHQKKVYLQHSIDNKDKSFKKQSNEKVDQTLNSHFLDYINAQSKHIKYTWENIYFK